MERRALFAVVISLVILVLYQEVILKQMYPPPIEEAGYDAHAEPEPIAPRRAEREAAPAPDREAELAEAPRHAPAPQGERIRVDTDLYLAIFSTAGARLESFQLKRYRTTVDPNSPPQETIVPSKGIELPLGVELRGPDVPVLSDAAALYTADASRVAVEPGLSRTLEFRWEGDSVTIRKRFTFHGDRYDFETDVSVQGATAAYTEIGLTWSKGLEPVPLAGGELLYDKAMFLDGRKLIEHPFNDLAKGLVEAGKHGNIEWAGFSGRHFFTAIVPVEPENPRVWLKLRDNDAVEKKLLFPIAGGGATARAEVYVGPKDFDALEAVGHSLSRAVELGWFGFIAIPLLHVLKLSHRLTGNYGIDIILLTMIIKVLFIPLTKRSFESMRAMQKLQPQMMKIREKFKDNSEAMNKEIMELYRRHKVNPLGGCLPMLLQIPVFIGLYSALMNAVELRHAPFMLWINDLSAPDRLGTLQLPLVQHPGVPILTLLMGVSMFVQQWMTPSAADPQQQKIMMIMPVMFTFMFVNFPAGLVLYWLVNNVLTIAQQYYINRSAT